MLPVASPSTQFLPFGRPLANQIRNLLWRRPCWPASNAGYTRTGIRSRCAKGSMEVRQDIGVRGSVRRGFLFGPSAHENKSVNYVNPRPTPVAEPLPTWLLVNLYYKSHRTHAKACEAAIQLRVAVLKLLRLEAHLHF